MDNLERIFNQQSEIHRAQLQQIDARLQEQGRRYGYLAVQGHENKNVPLWKKVVLEMIGNEQVLVVLGALAFGFIRLLIWAIPHIVKAVPVIYSRFANLANAAGLYLANVDWKEFIRRFANMGSEGGFNFEEFMNHRLTKEITGAKYGQIIVIFFGTLLEIILKQRGDLMKV
ncbi:unnamed protein product [Orchesella dallaii]|uniref:Uncharacterized protein n=1 Tax=Orchesella dallaii TaxID=48710 RepID=A0ABP1S6I9_9HEXA